MSKPLQVRRNSQGVVSVPHAPDGHTLSAGWIQRYLGDLVEVVVRIKADDGPVEYTLTGFEELAPAVPATDTDPGRPAGYNWTAWQCARATADGEG